MANITRRNALFESGLEKLARLMSGAYGVHITISGDKAYTNGKIINLPSLEDIDSELYMDMMAYLDHEVGHIKFTELPALRKCDNEFHKVLTNRIEDSRMEKDLLQEFPGVECNLLRLHYKIQSKENAGVSGLKWPLRLLIAIHADYDGRKTIIDPEIQPLFDGTEAERKALKKATNTSEVVYYTGLLRDKINKIREEMGKELLKKEVECDPDEECTRDEPSIELDPDRRKKKNNKRQAQGDEQYDPDINQGGDEGEGDDGESGDQDSDSKDGNGGSGESDEESSDESGNGDSKSENGDEESESDSSSESENESGDGDKDSKRGQSPKKSKGGDEKYKDNSVGQDINESGSIGGCGPSFVDDGATIMEAPLNTTISDFDDVRNGITEHIQQALEEVVLSQPSTNRYSTYYENSRYDKHDPKTHYVSLPYTREADEEIDYTGQGDKEQYRQRRNEVMPVVNPIKRMLERSILVKEATKFTPDRERGRLNRRTLHSLIADKNFKRVFYETSKQDTRNVAVSLVIDCSGSMGGSKIEVARKTALAIGESLKMLDIVCEITGFNTNDSPRITIPSGVDTSKYNRLNTALRNMIFKDFNSNDLTGICKAAAGGCNADGESITWAAKRLAARPEARKIMMVLSDGQPSYSCNSHEVLCGDLRRTVVSMSKIGIEVVGIGIMTDAPRDYYDNFAIVDNLDTLASKSMTVISDLILKEGKRTGAMS